MVMMKPWQWLMYIFFWSLFVTITKRQDLATGTTFTLFFAGYFFQNIISILPILYLIDYLRPLFKSMSNVRVSVYIIALFMISSAVTMILVQLIMINFNWIEYNTRDFFISVLLDSFVGGGFTLVFILYFLRRYIELNALKASFEYKLSAQNDLIKARIAPHFFFNTINTLIALMESNPTRASEILEHVSALFRASFNGAREISFEEEIALCEHYIAIESSRLGDKLVVNWSLPDEDIMYDMVITSLTLQSVLEKMLLNVVEMTTETIDIDIMVIWDQHLVTIRITVQLPHKTLMVIYDLQQHMNFYIQAERLRSYFGESAGIESKVTNEHVITEISYPLQDVGL